MLFKKKKKNSATYHRLGWYRITTLIQIKRFPEFSLYSEYTMAHGLVPFQCSWKPFKPFGFAFFCSLTQATYMREENIVPRNLFVLLLKTGFFTIPGSVKFVPVWAGSQVKLMIQEKFQTFLVSVIPSAKLPAWSWHPESQNILYHKFTHKGLNS